MNEALRDAVEGLKWSRDGKVRRIVFLVGDAPPHMDYANAPSYVDVVATARSRGIIVNAVQAGGAGDTRRIWQDIAKRGGGRYIPIPQDGGQVAVIETPFDGDILILQRRIDTTIIPYGPALQQDSLREKVELRAGASVSAQVENADFYNKQADRTGVVTGRGDLVADSTGGAVSLDAVPDEELPDALKGKTAAERQAYVDQKLAERAELTTQMADLMARRDAYIAAEQEKQVGTPAPDSFDRVVEDTLRAQLAE